VLLSKEQPAVDVWNFPNLRPPRLFCQKILTQSRNNMTQKQKSCDDSDMLWLSTWRGAGQPASRWSISVTGLCTGGQQFNQTRITNTTPLAVPAGKLMLERFKATQAKLAVS
jgi:hypothetical protein